MDVTVYETKKAILRKASTDKTKWIEIEVTDEHNVRHCITLFGIDELERERE